MIKIASRAQMAVYSPSKKSDESNKNSIVMRLSHGGNSFLFTGDIERADTESNGYKAHSACVGR